jgi:hypothetical protein
MSCRALDSRALPTQSRREAIIGLNVLTAFPCRCGCGVLRLAPYSVTSAVLTWRCVWCRRRRGKPTASEIEALVAFTDEHGWNQQPLRYSEADGSFHI